MRYGVYPSYLLARPHLSVAQDLNRINQANPHYTDLRARANRAGDAMARAFDQAHAAHERGDGARAKELSNEGRNQQREMEELNREASEWIFQSVCLSFRWSNSGWG
jgi:hypothetical protein